MCRLTGLDLVNDYLLGENWEFNDDEFYQIDEELMLDAPQEMVPVAVVSDGRRRIWRSACG